MIKPPGINQNAALFNRGNATSWTPNWVGNKKFPNAPKITGIIIKKTIITPWAVAILKYCKLSPAKTPTPGYANSSLIIVAKLIPAVPATRTKLK